MNEKEFINWAKDYLDIVDVVYAENMNGFAQPLVEYCWFFWRHAQLKTKSLDECLKKQFQGALPNKNSPAYILARDSWLASISMIRSNNDKR